MRIPQSTYNDIAIIYANDIAIIYHIGYGIIVLLLRYFSTGKYL